MLKPKENHIICATIISIIMFIVLSLICIKYIINPKELAPAMLSTSGIFIGFIISALGIYYSVPLREEIKYALIKQGYYKQVAKNFIISIIAFTIVVVLSIFSICIYNSENYLKFQHIVNSANISIFIGGLILVVLTSINFFKIVIKNSNPD